MNTSEGNASIFYYYKASLERDGVILFTRIVFDRTTLKKTTD